MIQFRAMILILCVAFFALTSCGGDNVVDPLTGPDSTATQNNLDGNVLRTGLQKIKDGEYGEVHSLIVLRNGDIILEEYFAGWSRRDLHEIFSATKSIASILTGMAIERGLVANVNTKLLDYFPEYETYENHSVQKDAITLHHVLTMTSGFQWDESQLGPVRGDWIKYVLDLPMAAAPGAQFNYNSGSSLLLGCILQSGTGETANQFAADSLFHPLQIFQWFWGTVERTTLPDFSDTSGGLAMRPFDLANIGMFMLQKGNRGGKQIVSQDWVTRSTGKQVSAETNYEYGYKWWRFAPGHPAVRNLSQNDVYFAWGAGGQFIFVIPHLQMVVVSTAENFDTVGSQMFGFLRDYIFAAVLD